jgi:hypothetical protein
MVMRPSDCDIVPPAGVCAAYLLVHNVDVIGTVTSRLEGE